MDAAVELPRYKSHKVVRAARITALRGNGNADMPDLVLGEIGAIVTELPDWHAKHSPHVGGFYVVYDDGYKSFSPAKAFEEGYTAEKAETFTQPKITGYRQLTPADAALMNEIKAHGQALQELIAKLRNNQDAITKEFGVPDGEAHRWFSIGQTHLQQGLMCLTRGVAKPESF